MHFGWDSHLWPPNSERPEYRLGNRAAARQGFYFYRNSRLIQAGGWNGLVQNDAEPHGSLARVRIDLRWETLDRQEVFRVDQDNGCLLLNQQYRDRILAGLPAFRDDVPLFKALLFCLLGSDFQTGKPSGRRRRELARINRILLAAAALEQG